MMEMMVYVAGGAAVLSIIVCVAKIVTRKRKIDKPYSDLLKKEIEAKSKKINNLFIKYCELQNK